MALGAFAELIWSYVDLNTIVVSFSVYWFTKFFVWQGYVFSKKNSPPGFFGFPFVDVMPYFIFGRETTLERFESNSKKYGPVIRYRRGAETMVVVTGVNAVREGFLNDDLLGRPRHPMQDLDEDNIFAKKSILNIEGDLWRKQRRFSLIALRDLGFGKTAIMEDRIQEEIRELVERIETSEAAPYNIHSDLIESTGNNMNSLVFGGKFHEGDDKKKQVYRIMTDIIGASESLIKILFIPFAAKLMKKLGIGGIKVIQELSAKLENFMTEDIRSHAEDLDHKSPRDIVDHFLIEQEKDKDFTSMEDFAENRSLELVLGNAVAFFFAGSSTVRVTVEYLLHLMAQYPEVQRKVQAEIDEEVGQSRVTWADSPRLPYTMAVIAERHRYFTVAPTGVPRKVLRPTKLCGYDLEANDQVIFNLDSVHFDPELFESPYDFKPERFIDQNGALTNTEKVWAFSIGKRACPGESLAVLEVFLYFATILQNFTIEADGPVKFRPLRGIIAETLPQELRFVRRV
ncbi:cytochrome P450 2J6 [Galendromus occidentalis]|uniref:Cytochrome P450 2J6 n=1 Tax=Galendromus occidentalis TaxID=34638 RepID=A0AAJ7L3Q6_9ACAR|nr:cytochrome P450 2J6 [Galendromus occidentalis]